MVTLAGGEAIEAAMIGHDGMWGGSSALDGLVSLNKAIVQLLSGDSDDYSKIT